MVADNFLAAGIEAFRQHRLEHAQSTFAKAVVANPNSEEAWLWLGRVIADPEHRLYCYQRVLEINPRNPEAATAFQYVAASARPASVQRALALANSQPERRDSSAPVSPRRPAITTPRPTAQSQRGGAMPGYALLNLMLILVFLSLYIAVEWYNVTTSVQNVAITPATINTRAIFRTPSPTRRLVQTLTPTTAPSPRAETNSGRPSDALFALAQKELDAKNSRQVLDILLPNLSKLTEQYDLVNAYYFLGLAELDLEDYSAAAGYFKKLYALEPSVEYLFVLAVSYDMAGDSTAAIEHYSALAAWNGKDAPIYHGLAERRISDIQQSITAKTPTATK